MAESIRPYIVINGKSSREVSGLLIVSLPPISKPQMRVTAEEIDGRDGDIVTELGFSAYDKPVEIGLAGDYDINEVISYFNQAGVITFSNEPDKYYKFAQYNGIDFEKLIRFKTATVIFHVQPFKYDTESNDAVFWNPENISITNEGNIYSKPELAIQGSGNVGITLNGSEVLSLELGEAKQAIIIDTDEMNAYGTKSNVKELITDINPVQDLHGYDSVWIGGGGKNKLQITATTQTINGITFAIDNEGDITTSGTFSENTNIAVTTNFFLKAGTYILNGCPSGGSYSRYVVRIENGSAQGLALDTGNGEQFTLAEDTYVWCRIYLYSSDGIGKTFKPMVRLATESDSSFAPYSNICPISGFSALNVTRTGVNLGNFQNGYGIDVSGNIVVQNNRVATVTPIIINPSLSYYVKGEKISDKRFIYAVFKDNTLIRRIANVTGGTLLDTTNGNKLFVCLYDNATVETNKPMVVFDNAITTYESYNGQTASVNFGQTVYGGSLNVTTGLLTITKIAHVFDGSESFLSLASGRVFAYVFSVNVLGSFVENSALCSHFHKGSTSWDYLAVGEYLIAGDIYGGVNPDMTLEDYRTYLQAQYNNGTPVTLVATLATPIEIQLTAEEIQTLIGTNVIYADTGAISELIYTKDGADVTTSGDIVSFDVDASDLRDDILKNRLVTGNYDNLRLKAGTNQIGITGDVDVLVLSNFSRWL